MSKPKAEFLGLYEADENRIYRVLISNCESFGESHFSISNPRDVDINILTINSPTGDLAPFTFELSIRVPRGFNKFSLFYRGARIASMNKIKAARLMIKRNIAMVNPAIDERYQKWLKLNPIDIPVPDHGPLISIICPLFNTPIPYLREMIDSVLDQTYRNWELVLVNASPDNAEMKQVLATYKDGRIKVIDLEDNLGIVGNTNIGISHTTGDYIAFLDHDDTVDRNLLSVYVNRIIEHPETDLFYCDEDNFCESLDDAYGPRFKPDFNLDLLYSHNYVLHCLMVSRYALNQIELSPEYVNGAQDYDLTLKTVEVARSIYHAPYILYHWRAHAGSTNGGEVAVKPYILEAGRRVVEEHFERIGSPLFPTISHIPCVYNIEPKTERSQAIAFVITYENVKNIVKLIATLKCQLEPFDKLFFIGPSKPPTIANLEKLGLEWSWLKCECANDFKQTIPIVAKNIDTPLTLFCTEGVRFNKSGCIKMLEVQMKRNEIAVAAPKLLYCDGLVEHAGIYVQENGGQLKLNRFYTDHMGGGYHGLAECACDYSLVTSDCFIVRTEDFRRIAKEDQPPSVNDLVVLSCIKARLEDKLIVVNPIALAEIYPLYSSKAKEQRHCHAIDVLSNPNVDATSGYMRLNIPHNNQKEFIRQLISMLTRRMRQ